MCVAQAATFREDRAMRAGARASDGDRSDAMEFISSNL